MSRKSPAAFEVVNEVMGGDVLLALPAFGFALLAGVEMYRDKGFRDYSTAFHALEH